MPTNLPPEAFAAEERYRQAQSGPERIAALEAYISAIPKHKGTDKLRADLLLLIDLQGFPIEELEESLALLADHHIVPADRREQVDETARAFFVPLLLVVNKWDDADAEGDYEVLLELLPHERPLLHISVENGRNLDGLKRAVFDRLQIICVYSKPPGEDEDRTTPFVLPKGSTVEAFAGEVHRDFVEQLKTARIWGTGVFNGQAVGRDHVLHDGDVVELHI